MAGADAPHSILRSKLPEHADRVEFEEIKRQMANHLKSQQLSYLMRLAFIGICGP